MDSAFRDFLDAPEPGQRRRKGRFHVNLFAWSVFIIMLGGFACFSWIACLYVFGHPEDPRCYAILKKFNKLEALAKFPITAAPQGRFHTARELREAWLAMPDNQVAGINKQFIHDYLVNYANSKTPITYITGQFTIVGIRELKDSDIFPGGLAVVAQSVDDPLVTIEQIYPAAHANIPHLRFLIAANPEIKIEKTYDLATVLHVEKLDDGKLLFTVIPLDYDNHALDGALPIEPPHYLNIASGMPVVRPSDMKDAIKTYALYRKTRKTLLAKNKTSTQLVFASDTPATPPPAAAQPSTFTPVLPASSPGMTIVWKQNPGASQQAVPAPTPQKATADDLVADAIPSAQQPPTPQQAQPDTTAPQTVTASQPSVSGATPAVTIPAASVPQQDTPSLAAASPAPSATTPEMPAPVETSQPVVQIDPATQAAVATASSSVPPAIQPSAVSSAAPPITSVTSTAPTTASAPTTHVINAPAQPVHTPQLSASDVSHSISSHVTYTPKSVMANSIHNTPVPATTSSTSHANITAEQFAKLLALHAPAATANSTGAIPVQPPVTRIPKVVKQPAVPPPSQQQLDLETASTTTPVATRPAVYTPYTPPQNTVASGVPLQSFMSSQPASTVPRPVSTSATWNTYVPGEMPRGKILDTYAVANLTDMDPLPERCYLRGRFVVTASEQGRAILRPQTSQGGASLSTRVIVDFPKGSPVLAEGVPISRGDWRPFEITGVRRGANGVVNIYAREITSPWTPASQANLRHVYQQRVSLD